MRIREHHEAPKGFIALNKTPIILESIQKLKQQGVNDILIVTGYNADFYNELAKTDDAITTLFNKKFSDSGSLYSLYCAKDWIKDEFLLLESDLIYETRAINTICNAPEQNVILLSGTTESGDEVYVETQEKQLKNMSKKRESLNSKNILGEFVGINKLGLTAYQKLVHLLETDNSLLENGNYEENGLVELSKHTPVYCLKIPDLLWCEIDNLDHLERAKGIYEKIKCHREERYTLRVQVDAAISMHNKNRNKNDNKHKT